LELHLVLNLLNFWSLLVAKMSGAKMCVSFCTQMEF
jgi:hypothetical protein